jgi:hypothetical protein
VTNNDLAKAAIVILPYIQQPKPRPVGKKGEIQQKTKKLKEVNSRFFLLVGFMLLLSGGERDGTVGLGVYAGVGRFLRFF